jgi:ABC-type transporter Mla maintaining outer membrane lipid asymmetry permease subunit MlaE
VSEFDRPVRDASIRETETFPVVQRGGIRFFRRITRAFIAFFRQVGARGYFLRDIGRAFGDPATFVPETIRQMRRIGVDSIPLTMIVAAFIGGVIAIQVRYQLFPGVQLSIIGLSVRLMQVLELGPCSSWARC